MFFHVGGSTDVAQTAVGIISQFNMWDYEMKGLDQLNIMSCGSQGNIVNWGRLLPNNLPATAILDKAFPICKGKMEIVFLQCVCLRVSVHTCMHIYVCLI